MPHLVGSRECPINLGNCEPVMCFDRRTIWLKVRDKKCASSYAVGFIGRNMHKVKMCEMYKSSIVLQCVKKDILLIF